MLCTLATAPSPSCSNPWKTRDKPRHIPRAAEPLSLLEQCYLGIKPLKHTRPGAAAPLRRRGRRELDMDTVVLALTGLLPAFEPRYALPLLAAKIGFVPAFAVAATEAILLALVLPSIAQRAWGLLLDYSRRLRFLGLLVARVEAAQQRARRLTSRYGLPGLALFVAIPLPVTGIYTGAVVSLLLGIDANRARVALAAGGLASLVLTSPLALGVQITRG
ncbi:MAG TPA: hypothetical protein EYH50_02170 [Pyrodictium delaneyi]|uniref:Ligand-binding protein SH3 n=1 Tax=Pyrodictium delaneyi TaxID=1273541 RepID=A0A833EAQ0_9CREN|nr:hypothetical protein [Pyrodictium delaneyi]